MSEPSHEPPHVHVYGNGGSAKIWLDPLKLADTHYSDHRTSEILRIIEDHKTRFLRQWRERFGADG